MRSPPLSFLITVSSGGSLLSLTFLCINGFVMSSTIRIKLHVFATAMSCRPSRPQWKPTNPTAASPVFETSKPSPDPAETAASISRFSRPKWYSVALFLPCDFRFNLRYLLRD